MYLSVIYSNYQIERGNNMKHYCYDCGTVFDDEEAGTLTEHHPEVHADEHFPCCPNCKSTEFGEAWQCEECGEWFSKDDVESYDGLCMDCLKKLCTPDTFLKYALESKSNRNYSSVLEEFVFDSLWEIGCPERTCDELIYLLADVYHAHKYDRNFQTLIHDYLENCNRASWWDFGEWLAEKRRAEK